ncbi:hypothetical protein ACFPC0_13900 [Streptomyces andamanensis]|uniref:Uncharacterized protein n=1 Tax=Streptomyces andamanensis TaxID=1565035 RepID=A0ABV8TEB7_9ACTN
MTAWLSVVPRPHIGSSRRRSPVSSRAGSSEASAVTFSRSRVKSSLVLPAYFWMVSRSLSNRSRGCLATGRSRSPSTAKRAYSDDRFDSSRMSVPDSSAALNVT